MFVDTMIPLHHISNNYFHDLIKLADPNLKLPSLPTFLHLIDEAFDQNRAALKKELQHIDTVVDTADIWSSFRKAFMGTTVNWIDPKTLNRKHDVLGCTRMFGAHTSASVGQYVGKALDSLGVRKKTKFCITDGAKNMKACFRYLLVVAGLK